MRFTSIIGFLVFGLACAAESLDRRPLSYAPKPEGTYVPPKAPGVVTLLDFIKSRSDLTELAKVINGSAGKSARVYIDTQFG